MEKYQHVAKTVGIKLGMNMQRRQMLENMELAIHFSLQKKKYERLMSNDMEMHVHQTTLKLEKKLKRTTLRNME